MLPADPTRAPAPRCSVVIVTWNRRAELEALLKSVFRQTIADSLEVIVVENGSTDGTAAWLRDEFPEPVKLVAFEKNEGACRGRNEGIRRSRGRYITFLDSDAELLDDGLIEGCLKFLTEQKEIRAVGAPIWMDRARTKPFVMGGYITPEGHFDGQRSFTETDDPHFLSTCFCVWEKSLLEELGGFNPWYFWGIEDMDISLRCSWNARRGRTKAASHFVILKHGAVLHEMSPRGRHYQPGDFEKAFHAIEWQRLYLVLSYGGLVEMLRVVFTTPFHMDRVQEDAWQQRLGWKKKIWCAVIYPLWRLLMLPKDLITLRKDHLKIHN
ncbi:hypothetical protein BH09SUM1_BH09SUM1_05900 [soil metagenome]